MLYGTSVHPYSTGHIDKPQFADLDEEFPEEYPGK